MDNYVIMPLEGVIRMAERKSVPYKDRKFDRSHQIEYNSKYRRENLDQINMLLPKGYKQTIKDEAAKRNLTMSEWIRNLIDEAIQNN